MHIYHNYLSFIDSIWIYAVKTYLTLSHQVHRYVTFLLTASYDAQSMNNISGICQKTPGDLIADIESALTQMDATFKRNGWVLLTSRNVVMKFIIKLQLCGQS